MERVNKIFNSIVFRRILVIFIVGLVSRIIVNYVYDVNVFKEYTSYISLVYFGIMACFSGYIHELPKISFNILDLKLIRSAIKAVLEGSSISKTKMLSSGQMFTDNLSSKSLINNLIKDSSVLKQEESDIVTAGRQKRFKSAGVRGLYGDPNDRNIVNSNLSNNVKEYSLRNHLKCRLLWPMKRFSGEYVTYEQYSRSFSPNDKVSIRTEIKKIFNKR